MSTADILGFKISAGGLAADVTAAIDAATGELDGPFVVACANPHSIVVASSDVDFEKALQDSNMLLPDGVGVVLASRVLRAGVSERVAGMEFFLEFSRRADRMGGISYFFLGSSCEVLEKIERRMAVEFPSIKIAGTLSPPFANSFSDSESASMIAAVNASCANVLWVGMTAPKQEKWVERHKTSLDVALIVSVGAVFDFYSGNKKRAPRWVQRIGLEWLPRLIREPRRLARRNLISTPIFLLRVVGQLFKTQ
jgi:N-acetylglucosaminyldiphosphoundecaprenol N-acetyl-beta-D-mannosaminyltransferase